MKKARKKIENYSVTEISKNGHFVLTFNYHDVHVDVWFYQKRYLVLDWEDQTVDGTPDIYEIDYKDIVMFHAFFSSKSIKFGNF